MKVFIIGGSGLVGGNCFRFIKDNTSWEVKASHLNYPTSDTVYFNASDLNDPGNFNIKEYAPDVIIHCGALSWVDYCEDHESESYEKSVIPAYNIIQLVQQINSKLVFISTDYIFDGVGGPYNEEDPFLPLNVYGKHKLLVENHIEKELKDYLICRITNVFGEEERGKNFIARLIREIKTEKEIKLPADQYATPVYAIDVARAIQLLLQENKKGIYHISNGEYLSRYDIGCKIVSQMPQSNTNLKKIKTSEMEVSTPRPLKGGLKNNKFLAEFPDFTFLQVSEYISKIIKNQE